LEVRDESGFTGCAAAADGEAAVAEEGHRKGHDVGCDVADDHHLIRVGWDEFGRHVGFAAAVACG
jgi:hypothetical protein